MLNLNRLRILMELQRLGTLAEVAAELHYTPSAVSQQLATFERELGVKLLQKTGRRVKLTDAALTLVGHGASVFAAIDAAEAELAKQSGPAQGTVRVASFSSILMSVAPIALTVLAKDHPELEVLLIQSEVDEAQAGLQSYAYDLVLGEEFPDEPMIPLPGLHRADFYADPLRIVIPRTQGTPLQLSSLHNFAHTPWAVEPGDTCMGRWTERTHRQAGIAPRVVCETTEPLLHVQMARTGHAVSFIPGILGTEHLAGVEVWDLPGNPTRKLYTQVRAGRETHPATVAIRTAFAHAAANYTIHPSSGVLTW